MNRLQELLEEIRIVFSGKNKTLDTIFPPLLYAVLQAIFDLQTAVIITVVVAGILTILRVTRKESWGYALSGLLLVVLSAIFAWFSNNASNFFLPDLILSGLLLLAAILSNLIGKPLAAWSSHLTRAWPRDWYWHKQIRPAYNEVTWLWALLIALRLAIQWRLYQTAGTLALGWISALLGWPVTLTVLILSYLYGIWRLQRLGGPSVEEFTNNQPPPYQGQRRGF
jgi:hypothetical protein